MKKIIVELTDEEACCLEELLGNQCRSDTKELIEKYDLNIDFYKTDKALDKIYHELLEDY